NPPADRLQKGFADIGDGRLAVRPGYRDHAKADGRDAVEPASQPTECQAGILHANQRNVASGQLPLRHHGAGPGPNRRLDVLVAVHPLAFHGDKQSPWLHTARIIGYIGDRYSQVAFPLKDLKSIFQRVDQLVQRHGPLLKISRTPTLTSPSPT